MIALDVNVVVSALREDAPDHAEVLAWLTSAIEGPEPTGVSEAVLTGSIRILTHPRVFNPPSATGEALDAIRTMTSHPGVVVLSPGPDYLAILDRLCRASRVRGNGVADAGHAATAIAHDATFVSKDRGFARFAGLRWRLPG